jgi:hypothetical protein
MKELTLGDDDWGVCVGAKRNMYMSEQDAFTRRRKTTKEWNEYPGLDCIARLALYSTLLVDSRIRIRSYDCMHVFSCIYWVTPTNLTKYIEEASFYLISFVHSFTSSSNFTPSPPHTYSLSAQL